MSSETTRSVEEKDSLNDVLRRGIGSNDSLDPVEEKW